MLPTARQQAAMLRAHSMSAANGEQSSMPARSILPPAISHALDSGGGLGAAANSGLAIVNQLSQPSSDAVFQGGNDDQKRERLYQLLHDLLDPQTREDVVTELSHKRQSYPELAPAIWYSVGTMAALLQEIMLVYPLLDPPVLTSPQSNRVCNALALLQCVASHSETRSLFLNAHIPLFLYPLLNTSHRTRAFEYLRLTSLGVIGALVKADDADVITFLLSTEIIPLCLRIMETGSELTKTVATFIVQKILIFDIGLQYICATRERFMAVCTVLNKMIVEKPTSRLFKHIVRCYLRLCDHAQAREALRQLLPDALRSNAFAEYYKEDEALKVWVFQLMGLANTPAGPMNGRPMMHGVDSLA